MAADTMTREDELRQFVELDALGLFLVNLVSTIADGKLLRTISWDSLDVVDHSSGNTGNALCGRLFPGERDLDEQPDFNLAAAKSATLRAEILAWLASDEGRNYCISEAADCLRHARRDAEAEERLTSEGDEDAS